MKRQEVCIAVVRKIGESEPVLGFRPAESMSNAHATAAAMANDTEVLAVAVVIWEPVSGLSLHKEYKGGSDSYKSVSLFASKVNVDREVAMDIITDQAFNMAFAFTSPTDL